MPDYTFFRMGPRRTSWHLISRVEADRVYSRCGRSAAHPVEAVTILPGNQKTCERCLVFAARDNDT